MIQLVDEFKAVFVKIPKTNYPMVYIFPITEDGVNKTKEYLDKARIRKFFKIQETSVYEVSGFKVEIRDLSVFINLGTSHGYGKLMNANHSSFITGAIKFAGIEKSGEVISDHWEIGIDLVTGEVTPIDQRFPKYLGASKARDRYVRVSAGKKTKKREPGYIYESKDKTLYYLGSFKTRLKIDEAGFGELEKDSVGTDFYLSDYDPGKDLDWNIGKYLIEYTTQGAAWVQGPKAFEVPADLDLTKHRLDCFKTRTQGFTPGEDYTKLLWVIQPLFFGETLPAPRPISEVEAVREFFEKVVNHVLLIRWESPYWKQDFAIPAASPENHKDAVEGAFMDVIRDFSWQYVDFWNGILSEFDTSVVSIFDNLIPRYRSGLVYDKMDDLLSDYWKIYEARTSPSEKKIYRISYLSGIPQSPDNPLDTASPKIISAISEILGNVGESTPGAILQQGSGLTWYKVTVTLPQILDELSIDDLTEDEVSWFLTKKPHILEFELKPGQSI